MVLSCVLAVASARLTLAVEGSQAMAAVNAVTNQLVLGQLQSGPLEGAWPEEEAYTGSIVAGLVNAYRMTWDENARIAATVGGNFILRAAAGNYYGDEAYALMCLSEISDDGPPEMWWFALDDFYRSVSSRSQGGTAGYVEQFRHADPSVAVFYLAHHSVVALYVDSEDKDIWREALIDYLVQVDDDSADSPVMALGIATWALALTGPLDDSPLDADRQAAPYWQARTFDELPELLLTHQIQDGELAGNFYWRFDHGSGVTGGPSGGYTEELVSSALGLSAAGEVIGLPGIESAKAQIRELLVQSVADDGSVRQHAILGGEAFYSEAAGVLRALGELTEAADLDLDGRVDGKDLAVYSRCWQETDLGPADRCVRADLSGDGEVDARDLVTLSENWLIHGGV